MSGVFSSRKDNILFTMSCLMTYTSTYHTTEIGVMTLTP